MELWARKQKKISGGENRNGLPAAENTLPFVCEHTHRLTGRGEVAIELIYPIGWQATKDCTVDGG